MNNNKLEPKQLNLYKQTRTAAVAVYLNQYLPLGDIVNLEALNSDFSDLFDEAYEHGRQSVLAEAKEIVDTTATIVVDNMMKINEDGVDRTDAPEGYIAVASGGSCTKCALSIHCKTNPVHQCISANRIDRKDVIFVKKIKPVAKDAAWKE